VSLAVENRNHTDVRQPDHPGDNHHDSVSRQSDPFHQRATILQMALAGSSSSTKSFFLPKVHVLPEVRMA
jgi:hypothetical protein